MELGPSSSRSGSLRIEGFQVAQSGDSAFAHLVTTPAARKPAADSPFSRLLKADSAPQGGPRGGLKLKLPPRALKTAASTAAPSAPSAEPTPSVQCLRKAQSCGLGGMPALSPASSAPVPVPTAGSCRLRSSPCDSTLGELAAAWAGEPAALEALPLAARGSLASLRSLPTAATAGSQSSCSTAAGWALMSSGSSPCMASPAAPHAAGSHGGERERELWATRAEAVTYAVQLRGLEHLAKRGQEHMHTITEERDLLRRECAELRAAIGAGGAARGGCGGAGAGFGAGADEFPTAFPMDTDAATPRLAAAEAVLMETCHAPPRRSFESLCFVAAPAVRKPLFGFAS